MDSWGLLTKKWVEDDFVKELSLVNGTLIASFAHDDVVHVWRESDVETVWDEVAVLGPDPREISSLRQWFREMRLSFLGWYGDFGSSVALVQDADVPCGFFVLVGDISVFPGGAVYIAFGCIAASYTSLILHVLGIIAIGILYMHYNIIIHSIMHYIFAIIFRK